MVSPASVIFDSGLEVTPDDQGFRRQPVWRLPCGDVRQQAVHDVILQVGRETLTQSLIDISIYDS